MEVKLRFNFADILSIAHFFSPQLIASKWEGLEQAVLSLYIIPSAISKKILKPL
jgi:hypothetical protein